MNACLMIPRRAEWRVPKPRLQDHPARNEIEKGKD